MVRKIIGKILENITIKNLRDSIKQRVPVKGHILDNGSGFRGSWDYNGQKDIFSLDLLYGDDCTNLTSYPEFKKDKLDFIVFAGVIQYVKDYEKAIKESYKVLKPNGMFLITTINKESMLRQLGLITKKPKFGENHLFTIEEIEELLQKHKFKIMEKWGVSFIPNLPFHLCSNICYLARK